MKNIETTKFNLEHPNGIFYSSIGVTVEKHLGHGEEDYYYTVFVSAYAPGLNDEELQESVVGYGHSASKALQRLEQDTIQQLKQQADRHLLDVAADSKIFYLRVLEWIYTGE